MQRVLLRASMIVTMAAFMARANNLAIANVRLDSINSRLSAIVMDLSWENSWRDEFNHDAVWLFAKYSLDGGVNWRHATLDGPGINPAGFAPGSHPDLEIVVPDDRKGVFVQRTSQGRGTLSTSELTLIWDLEADGVPRDAVGRISVFGIEMVYIPEGPFYVGDGVSAGSFKVTYINSADMANTTATGSGTIADPRMNLEVGMGRPYGVGGTFDPGYPNGYNAFYIMKYELTQGGYVDFLNHLTATQYATLNMLAQFHIVNFYTTQKGGAITGTHPNLTNAQPWRAASFRQGNATYGYSHWIQYFAYVDWAGLRPFTEMEYEKACRGPLLPRERDFPWGLSGRLIVNKLDDVETPAESAATPGANLVAAGNHASLLPAGPLRNGGVSDAESDQFDAGASYYGVMELAGNVGERTVATSTHVDALNFSGRHGDGELNSDGTANVTNWPYQTSVRYGGGSVGTRGGDAVAPSLECAISDRSRAQQNYYTSPGMRAARTAPTWED